MLHKVAKSWGLSLNLNKCVVLQCQCNGVDWPAIGSLKYYQLNVDLSLVEAHKDTLEHAV